MVEKGFKFNDIILMNAVEIGLISANPSITNTYGEILLHWYTRREDDRVFEVIKNAFPAGQDALDCMKNSPIKWKNKSAIRTHAPSVAVAVGSETQTTVAISSEAQTTFASRILAQRRAKEKSPEIK